MGLSRMLLIVAVAVAVAPLVATRLRPPVSIRELEMAFVFGIVTLGVGLIAVSRFHHLEVFLVAHLGYLLTVVTAPLLLGGWWITAYVRRRRTLLVRFGGLMAAVLGLLGIWGTHIEPNWLRTDHVALAADVDEPLRIAVLADLQTPNIGPHEWRAVDAVLAEDPDLVVVPGDLFQGSAEAIAANTPDFVGVLEALVDQVGVVAVVSGDSDGPSRLQPLVEAAGAMFLDNRIVDVTIGRRPVRLAGVAVTASTAKVDTIAATVTAVDAVTVLVSHRPDVVFDLPPGADVDLIVSGHTHGGQISLPVIGPPVTFSDVPRRLAAGGLGVVDDFPLYVSTGVGLERSTAPQVRLGVRPSIGIIDIVPAEPAG